MVKGFFLTALFLTGAFHWVSFFHGGDLALTAYDWTKESAYLNTLRGAQIFGEIPWQWKEVYFKTRNFLGNPEIKLTPDIVLLRWLDNSAFALAHTLAFYSLGFLGSFLLAGRLKASAAAFTAFWLYFNFNGYITAHLAVGHFQWTGYFLFPFFFFFLLESAEKSRAGKPSVTKVPVLGMALVLGGLLWNGSFHIAFSCLLFMAATLIFQRRMLLNVLATAALAGLLGLGRVLPALVSLRHENPEFISGYPGMSVFIDALTRLCNHTSERVGGIFGDLGWWEYDMYIGFAGFALLAGAVWVAARRPNRFFPSALVPAALVMLLLSFGNVYALLAKAPIPLVDIERVSSRFVILPFMTALLAGIIGVDELFRSYPRFGKPFILLALPFTAYELLQHSSLWKISRVEASAEKGVHLNPQLALNTDQFYASSVFVGWFVSLTLLSVVLALLWQSLRSGRLHHKEAPKQ